MPGTGMRRGAVGALAVVLLLLVAVGSATSASTTAQANTNWRAILATPPANAATGANRFVYINSISCPSRGNCSAVGEYIDTDGHLEGLLLNETAGHWADGHAVFPANAASNPQVGLSSVTCSTAGNCTAVGNYYGKGGRLLGLLLTEKAGHWGPGVQAKGAYYTMAPDSVSCVSARNCTAAGSFNEGGLLLTEKSGQWGRPVNATAYAGPTLAGANLYSVSCAPDGGCSAVGYWYPHVGRNDDSVGVPVLLSEKNGRWRHFNTILRPQGVGEGAVLTSVSCVAGGNCSAIGLGNVGIDYSGAPSGFLLTEKAGKWLPGVKAVPPANATGSGYWKGYVGLDGISCAGRGNCVAIGTYSTDGDHLRWTLLSGKAGKWRQGVEALVPPDAKIPWDAAVSCPSPGNCTVVGDYDDGVSADYYDGVGVHGILFTETNGVWSEGVTAPLPAHSIFAVSCASPGNCGAVGADESGNGVLLDSTTAP